VKRTRHTPEQVIRKLHEADGMLAEGKGIAEVAEQLGVSENTYHRWRNQYGGATSRASTSSRTRTHKTPSMTPTPCKDLPPPGREKRVRPFSLEDEPQDRPWRRSSSAAPDTAELLH